MTINGGIGIDFGTRACRAGVFEGGKFKDMSPDMSVHVNPVAIITHKQRVIPGKGDPLTSHTARDQIRIETVKANLGTGKRLRDVKGYLPETLEDRTRDLLQSLRSKLEMHLGAGIPRAAVCVPSCYGMNQRAALRAAARLAGFTEVALIDESVAAAMFHYRGRTDSTHVLAYCLGKGVFTTSVLSLVEGQVRAVFHEGTTRIGGQNFDVLLAEEILHRMFQANGAAILKDPKALHALLLSAEQAKIALDSREELVLEMGPMKDMVGHPFRDRMVVSKSLLEKLVCNLVGETVALAKKAVEGAGLVSNEIKEILLVGEATRTAIVKRELEAAFGCRCVHAVPHSVACGAALYASSLWNCIEQKAESKSTPDSSGEEKGILPGKVDEIRADGEEKELFFDALSGTSDVLESAYHNFRRSLVGRDPVIGVSAFEELSNRAREDLSYLFSRRSSELRQEGKNDEALACLERGLKHWPANTHIKRLLAASYADIALRLASQRRIPQAEVFLRKSLDLDPSNTKAALLMEDLGRAFGGRGKHSRGKRGKR